MKERKGGILGDRNTQPTMIIGGRTAVRTMWEEMLVGRRGRNQFEKMRKPKRSGSCGTNFIAVHKRIGKS